MWLIAALLVLALPVRVQAQPAVDTFSCIRPERLSERTLEYRALGHIWHWTVAPVATGDRSLVRVTKRRAGDAATTVEHRIDLEATSLVPVAFRVISADRGLM